jgi:hypothetical protein
MATSILLLDCSEDLANKLRALGHEVHVGTSGYCARNPRKLDCQVYETDLVIYNPSIPTTKSVKYGLKIYPQDDSPDIDFRYETITKHVGDGGHWLVFANPIGDDANAQNRLYSWLPMKLGFSFTKDQKLKGPSDPNTWMDKFYPLIRSSRAVRVNLPVRLKVAAADLTFAGGSGSFHSLVENLRNEPLAGVFSLFMGTMTVMPSCENNDDAAMFFIDRVWPQLKPSASRGGLVEEFRSRSEEELGAEDAKLYGEFSGLEARYHANQKFLGEASKTKRATIANDETARRVIGYYTEAEQDEKDAPKHLYKVRDAIKNRFGSEKDALTILVNCDMEWEIIGLMTNGPDRDERHAPKLGNTVKPLTPDELKTCFAAAKKLIFAYLQTLFLKTPPPTSATPSVPPMA